MNVEEVYMSEKPENILEKYGIVLPKSIISTTSGLKQSEGANISLRGSQDTGKSYLLMRIYEDLIDNHGYLPSEAVGNLHILNDRYNKGYQVLKGDNLRDYLWKLTHVPLRHRIVLIDEIDSEFPARFFQDKEQTEIALRMWHNMKLRNYVIMTSHLGNGADLIFSLASNILIIPHGVDWQTNTLDYTVINGFYLTVEEFTCEDVVEHMADYDRWEMTENTDEDKNRARPVKKEKRIVSNEIKRDGVKKVENVIKVLL